METPPPSSRAPLWRRILPFVLAVALVGAVLARLDHGAFLRHLARVDAPAFLGFALVFVLSLLSADTFATVLVYRRSVAPIGFREFWVLRGASYLPSLLNHHVGQAFITVALSKRYDVPLARALGATLVVYASWMGAVLGLTSFALLMMQRHLVWVAVALGSGVLYLVLLAIRPGWLARRSVLAPLFEAGVGGHLFALAARLPHLVVLFVGTWIPFRFFGVDIPLLEALSTIPIVMVAVTLPITPQGFGTRDVLSALFFERFASGATAEERLAALAAATTSWGVALTLIEAAIGLILLRRAIPAYGGGGSPSGEAR